MIVGIDTYHDTKTRGRSVAGVVATLNHTFTKYYSQCSFQDPGVELLVQLGAIMKSII
jgi:aubergine-like protein